MKKLLAIFILFTLFSCQIEYDGTTKYIIKTKVVDKDGNPVDGVTLGVLVSVGGLSDAISLGKTDQNGEAVLMFPPAAGSEAQFSISYNQGFNNFEPTNYFSKTIYNIKHSDFENYLFNTGVIVLYKNAELTQLSISKVQTSENTQVTALSTTAITAESEVYFNAPENNWYPSIFYVLKNQTFLINYTVTNYSTSPPTSNSYSQEVTVGNEPLEYTITY